MTIYPAQIDNSTSLPIVIDNSTAVKADTVNKLRQAIIAIEQELGVKPSSLYSSVRGRLDILENIVATNVIALAGDIGGTTANPLVIGIQGRLVSSTAPSANQSLVWDGLVWKPSFTAALSAVSEADINFVVGMQISPSATPFALGNRTLDLTPFVPVLGDGRVRNITFAASVEVSNTGVDGYIELYDVTHDVAVTNTLFHFTNNSIQEFETSNLTVGSSNGNIRNDAITTYEVRLWRISASSPDRAICHNARLTIAYT